MAASDRERALRALLGEGVVIPAHPLALTAERRLDERHQRALTRYYVDQFNREFKKKTRGISPEGIRYLEAHAWPGNIRELRNAVERAMLLSDGEELTVADFSVTGGGGEPMSQAFKLPPAGISLEELERSLVEQALARAQGNQTRAAALLGLNRDQVRYRIEKFNLAKPEHAAAPDKLPT